MKFPNLLVSLDLETECQLKDSSQLQLPLRSQLLARTPTAMSHEDGHETGTRAQLQDETGEAAQLQDVTGEGEGAQLQDVTGEAAQLQDETGEDVTGEAAQLQDVTGEAAQLQSVTATRRGMCSQDAGCVQARLQTKSLAADGQESSNAESSNAESSNAESSNESSNVEASNVEPQTATSRGTCRRKGQPQLSQSPLGLSLPVEFEQEDLYYFPKYLSKMN